MRGWRDLGVASRLRSSRDIKYPVSYVNDGQESSRNVLCFVDVGVYLEGLQESVDSIGPSPF
jgi:hypothetical protein